MDRYMQSAYQAGPLPLGPLSAVGNARRVPALVIAFSICFSRGLRAQNFERNGQLCCDR
jgi:hypothetical protein